VKRSRYSSGGDDGGWSGTKMRTQTSRSSGTTTSRGDDMVEQTTRGRGGANDEGAWWIGQGGGSVHRLDDNEGRR
jgi:hypothetical protein